MGAKREFVTRWIPSSSWLRAPGRAGSPTSAAGERQQHLGEASVKGLGGSRTPPPRTRGAFGVSRSLRSRTPGTSPGPRSACRCRRPWSRASAARSRGRSPRARVHPALERRRCSTMNSAARAWLAKDMSMTCAGCPSAAARLIRRPSPSRLSLPPVGERELIDDARARAPHRDICRSAGMSISTLKWPVLARIAPSFMPRSARAEDGLVAGGGHEEVADLGGLAHGHHRKPSMTASIAFSGSIPRSR